MSINHNLSSLPEHWKWVELEDILLSVVGGGTPSKSNSSFWKGDIPWLTVKDMRTTRPKSTKDHISLDAVDNSSTKLLPADTIIVATRIGLGKLVRVPFPTTINQDLKGLFLSKYLNKSYVEYWYLSKASYIESIGAGTTVKGIRLEQLKSLKFPLAPEAVQKSIVEKVEELFSHIDVGVEGLKQAKAKLQQYRQSVLKDAVTGKLTEKWREKNADKLEPASELLERILEERRTSWETEQLKIFEKKGKIPKDDTWKEKYKIPKEFGDDEQAFNIPEVWEWCYFESIGVVTGGLTKNSKRNSLEKTLPYLRVANVYANELRLDEIKDIGISDSELDRVLLEDKDLLIVEGNGSPDQIGRLAVWDDSISPCVHQNHLIKVRLIDKALCDYIVFWLTSLKGREQIKAVASSTSGLYTLSISKISGLAIPLPSVEEAIEISKIVSEKLSASKRTEEELTKKIIQSKKLKSSILDKAFSGELVGNIKTDESAEQLLENILDEKQQLEDKAKLAKKKPNARTKKMEKRPIIDVLKDSKKTLKVDELFEQSGFQNDVTPEGIEAFYQELKTVTEDRNVEVTPIILDGKKQGDKFKYKEVKENEVG